MRRAIALCAVLAASAVACREQPEAQSTSAIPGSTERQLASRAVHDGGVLTSATSRSPEGPRQRLFARRFVVKVRKAPSKDAFRLGYLRAGAVLEAKSSAPIGFDKCRKGWFELNTGGFVCSTVDVIAFVGTRLPERRTLQPTLDTPLPYPYAYSRRRNTPVFRRLPTDEEAALYEGTAMPARSPRIEAQAITASPPTLLVANDASPAPASAAEQTLPASGAPGAGSPDSETDAGVPTLASLQGEAGSVLARRMERGFYVSLDREMEKGARKYVRTQSNGFIPQRGLLEVKPGEFAGLELTETSLPIAFVMSRKHFAYELRDNGKLRKGKAPGYHHRFRVAGTLTQAGTEYVIADDGRHFRKRDVTQIDAREKPAEVAANEKWIDIDLSAQTLVAYVGDRPVYATLVSTGRVKDPLDPQKTFETPTGAFRITSKHLTATMDGDHAIDGPYSIEDVPYVMYFQLAYALHAAFWHNAFGRPRSHGCINLAPLDARWLFGFADPPLPAQWHGVYPETEAHGTRLYVRGETPEG